MKLFVAKGMSPHPGKNLDGTRVCHYRRWWFTRPWTVGHGATVSENGVLLAELYDTISVTTNNVAEYSGLIAGLKKAHELDPLAIIHVKMDSKLVVEQMSGRWQIKHPICASWQKQSPFDSFDGTHYLSVDSH
jgi:ribonuclease HI